MGLHLTSTAFRDGERIPDRYTCTGKDESPPLAWTGAPSGTRSFALVCDDPDAPAGTWHHWAVFDIPVTMSSLPGGFSATGGGGRIREAVNDFRRPGYGGPCPPVGHGTHRYNFRLFALDVDALPLNDRVRCPEVAESAREHALATVVLVGHYSR